jgi:hypothetical protein
MNQCHRWQHWATAYTHVYGLTLVTQCLSISTARFARRGAGRFYCTYSSTLLFFPRRVGLLIGQKTPACPLHDGKIMASILASSAATSPHQGMPCLKLVPCTKTHTRFLLSGHYCERIYNLNLFSFLLVENALLAGDFETLM